jgi:hypothetical protein
MGRLYVPVSPLRCVARLRALVCILLVSSVALMAVPSATAHPLVLTCNYPTDVWYQSYISQFDPTDPNTWFSTIVVVYNISDPCSDWSDYPAPCFAQRPWECDARHGVWVPYCWLPECHFT